MARPDPDGAGQPRVDGLDTIRENQTDAERLEHWQAQLAPVLEKLGAAGITLDLDRQGRLEAHGPHPAITSNMLTLEQHRDDLVAWLRLQQPKASAYYGRRKKRERQVKAET